MCRVELLKWDADLFASNKKAFFLECRREEDLVRILSQKELLLYLLGLFPSLSTTVLVNGGGGRNINGWRESKRLED